MKAILIALSIFMVTAAHAATMQQRSAGGSAWGGCGDAKLTVNLVQVNQYALSVRATSTKAGTFAMQDEKGTIKSCNGVTACTGSMLKSRMQPNENKMAVYLTIGKCTMGIISYVDLK